MNSPVPTSRSAGPNGLISVPSSSDFLPGQAGRLYYSDADLNAIYRIVRRRAAWFAVRSIFTVAAMLGFVVLTFYVLPRVALGTW